jgi:hypothetical protein
MPNDQRRVHGGQSHGRLSERHEWLPCGALVEARSPLTNTAQGGMQGVGRSSIPRSSPPLLHLPSRALSDRWARGRPAHGGVHDGQQAYHVDGMADDMDGHGYGRRHERRRRPPQPQPPPRPPPQWPSQLAAVSAMCQPPASSAVVVTDGGLRTAADMQHGHGDNDRPDPPDEQQQSSSTRRPRVIGLSVCGVVQVPGRGTARTDRCIETRPTPKPLYYHTPVYGPRRCCALSLDDAERLLARPKPCR